MTTLYYAFKNGDNIDKLEEIINIASNSDLMWALHGACEGGHKNLIEKILKVIPDYCDWGLSGACKGGKLNIAKMMIDIGARNFNWALYCACINGNVELVKFIISKGATDFHWGLQGAIVGDNPDVIKLMIDKGTKDIHSYYSYPKNRKEIFNLLKTGVSINKLSEIDNYDLLIQEIKEKQYNIFTVLDNYLIPDLAIIVSKFCL